MIQTVVASGRLIDLDNVKAEDICLQDIAVGLAQPRFKGHARDEFGRPYTIGQHSCLMHDWFIDRGLKPEAQYSLLHDAAEVYIGDLHSGLKSQLGGFVSLEGAIMSVILAKYHIRRLTRRVKSAVLWADQAILQNELAFFWPERFGGANVEGQGLAIVQVWHDPIAEFSLRAERYWK